MDKATVPPHSWVGRNDYQLAGQLFENADPSMIPDLAENQTHGQRIITALRKGAMSVQELVDVLDGPTYGVLSETLKRGLNKNIGSNSTMTVSKNGPTNKGARRNQHVE